jgi:hypothetical protein
MHTRWVSIGEGETVRSLVAFVMQSGWPDVVVATAAWVVEHVDVFAEYGTLRTNLAFVTGSIEPGDLRRVSQVLLEVARLRAEYFGEAARPGTSSVFVPEPEALLSLERRALELEREREVAEALTYVEAARRAARHRPRRLR